MSTTTSKPKKGAAKSATKAKSSPKAPAQTEPALKELFLDEIKDIYWAEKKLVATLPKMQKAATSSVLAEAIGNHWKETNVHVDRLEKVFKLLGEKVQAKKCDAMDGLTKEGASIIEDTEDGTSTRDVGIIMASQKLEHYEIATYGCLAQLATTLGLDDVAELLSQTLSEEKQADEKLTGIAENDINYEAAEEQEEE